MIFSYMFRWSYLIGFLIIALSCKPSPTQTSEITVDISTAQAAEFHSKGYNYIDIRTQKEIEDHGTIKGATHIDYKSGDFEDRVASLDKNKKYIVFCASGGRSGRSKSTFQKHNITMVNMKGGYNQWKSENK